MDEPQLQELCENVKEAGADLRVMRQAPQRTGFGDAASSSSALAIVERLLAGSKRISTARLVDLVFRELAGIEAEELRELLVGRGEMVGRAGARRLRDQVAELLGCRLDEASALLGASASRFRRNDRLRRDVLDRAYAAVDVYMRVAAVLDSRGGCGLVRSAQPGVRRRSSARVAARATAGASCTTWSTRCWPAS